MVSQKSFALFISLIVVSFFLFLVDRWGILQGVRSTLLGVFMPAERVVHQYSVTLPFLANQRIQKLQQENDSLRSQLAKSQQLKKENEDLQKQLGVAKDSPQKLLLAHVLSTGTYFIIDKGSNDGLREGMTVMTQNMYVGKIFRVQPNVSRLLLPIETESVIAAVNQNKTAKGLVRGNGSSMSISEVLLSEILNQKDVLVTVGSVDDKGIGIRPDLELGKVIEVKKSENKLFQEASIEPSIKYKELTDVFIAL